MNANGQLFLLKYGTDSYWFNELRFTVTNKTEDTPLVGGELYRVRAAASGEVIYLRARINHDDIFSYRTLLNELACDTEKTLSINTVDISDYTLLTGKAYTKESECFSVCEMTLVKTDG